jgi:UDP-N-acetylglucosamine 2-epimerase
MKVVTVVGARPQFIKAAVVSHVLRERHQEILVHTGQHYDYNMSEQFFNELAIPRPNYNLGISGGSHAEMTGNMMIALEKVFIKEKPDCLLLYGDTNSTLAGALAAAKLYIPICHVEAGARTHSKTNPEEINRICTDHMSTLLLAATQSGMDSMSKEGLSGRGVLVGDPMYDAFRKYNAKRKLKEIKLRLLEGDIWRIPEKYYYLTCHREENTGDDTVLYKILNAMEQLEVQTIYPVHPRNRERVLRLKEQYLFRNIIFTEPLGYLENICLINHAEKVVTDSGGVQREAFFAGKKCVTVLNFVCWPETMIDGRNELSSPESEDILEKLSHTQKIDEAYQPFGDGHSADKIVNEITDM